MFGIYSTIYIALPVTEWLDKVLFSRISGGGGGSIGGGGPKGGSRGGRPKAKRAAAPACLAIACDREVGDEVRLSAAEQLAAVDPGAAVPAGLAIARDEEVGDEVRLSAAQLAALDPSV